MFFSYVQYCTPLIYQYIVFQRFGLVQISVLIINTTTMTYLVVNNTVMNRVVISRRGIRVRNSAEAVEQKGRKPSPLSTGGTRSGEAALGKDASKATKSKADGIVEASSMGQIIDGRFVDSKWIKGRWDLEQFKNADGQIDWDEVIDAEMSRRRQLENSPIDSMNEDKVLFSTDEIPWWAWVRRFHLPQAEKLNGRAAMVGYVMALFVDQLTGVGLLDQQNSFLGKLLLHITVFGVLLIQSNDDVKKYAGLLSEATFYDEQWNASWKGRERPQDE
eukprot:TRINITY_DN1809_c0_g2_i1.p2 TRINITY_DN1809_c0_g2~~TRINITY_DN1809_c0_g2_i1.p2  ORF type:complete len:275 (-),score=40.08 TRINITY_DN1809_c0_g2_i1:246-1070(-)